MPEQALPSEMTLTPEHAYQSLYRRYRPQHFSEVRGQDHVVLALRHAVRDDRVAHAYLFSGPRGTGKTSTARILAKALNCSDPVEGEPCGVCDACRDITRGSSFDVIELDAASNNGVDAMRQLVASASLASPGRWKVYIVDEVHMLSTAASNALLKTLEEPPDHVVFVLATTDPQKVLPTIRSRTQHYEFHLLEPEVLADLLGHIAADAELELPEAAVEAAVRRGRGSARDALSALDQVAASGVVEDDSPFLAELVAALAERDTPRALEAVQSALVAGRDAPRLAGELLEELRGQFLRAVAPAAAAAPAAPALGPARSVRAMEVLGAALVAMRDALDARTTLEVALVRLTHPEVDGDAGALLERIERLERKVNELVQHGTAAPPPAAPPPPPPPPPPPRAPAAAGGEAKPALGAYRSSAPESSAPVPEAAAPAPTPAPAPPPVAPAPAGPLPSRDELVAAWGDHILGQLPPRVRAVYAAGRFLAVEGDEAVFALPNPPHVERAEASVAAVEAAVSSHFGTAVRLRLVPEPGTGAPPPAAPTPAGDVSAEPAAAPAAARAKRARPPAAVAAAQEPDGLAELEHEELDPLSQEVAGSAETWAADRLLQAFPGAEEVQ